MIEPERCPYCGSSDLEFIQGHTVYNPRTDQATEDDLPFRRMLRIRRRKLRLRRVACNDCMNIWDPDE